MKKQEHHKSTPEKQKNSSLHSSQNIGIKNIYFFIIIAALIAVVYGVTIGYDYSYFDDDAVIIKNKEIYSQFSNAGISFTTDAELGDREIELYRPLQSFTFFVDAAIGGVKPGMFHFSNLLYHLLTCIALYFLFIKLKVSDLSKFVFTMLFAIHPLFTHAIAWIPSRGDILLALTVILAFSTYINFEQTQKKIFFFGHIIFIILALLSKETAIFAGPLFILFSVLILQKKLFRKQNYVLILLYAIITLIYLYLRKNAIAPAAEGSFGIPAFIANLPTFPELFSIFVFPLNIPLMPFYNTFRIASGLIVIISLLIIALKFNYFKKPLFVFGLIWFALFTIPAMLYRPLWSSYSYDYHTHRSYLPFVGIFISLSVIFSNILFSKKRLVLITAILIIPLTIVSAIHVKAYKNALSFSVAACKENPESVLGLQYLGNAYFMENDFDNAIKNYSAAIVLKKDFPDAWLNRGMANAKLKKFADAVSDFTKAYELNPARASILKYKANALFEDKKYEEAILSYNLFLKKKPNDSEIIFKRGQASFFLKKYTEAINDFTLVISQYPDNTDALLMRGNAYIILQENSKAITDFSLILKKDSTNIDAINNLGFIYLEINKPDSALIFFTKALKIKQNHTDAILGTAIAENMNSNSETAKIYFNKACTIEPLLNQGMSGIVELEKQGYFYTEKQKEMIRNLFSKYQK